MFILNKFLGTFAPKMSKGSRGALSAITPLAVLFPLNLYLTSQTKEAAKVGRHKAKQELTQDLSKLAYFDDEALKKAKIEDYKPQKKGIFDRIKIDFKFIPQYLKDRKEFQKYKKTNWFEEEKFYIALKTVPITEEQEKDAKNLQEKVFFVFDELDEMSQQYSEHVEGGIGLAQNAFKVVKGLTMITAVMLPLYCLFTGKFPIAKAAKKLSDVVLKKDSQIKKNIDEVYNIAHKDKNIKKMINKSCAFEDNSFMTMIKEPKLQQPLRNLISAFTKDKKNIKKQIKDGKFAKWGMNLVNDLSQIALNKLSKVPKEELEAFRLGGLIRERNAQKGNLKTLKLTLLALGIPVLMAAGAVSYTINSFFAHLQKKAGFIGVMNSIKKLDNAEYFVSKG